MSRHIGTIEGCDIVEQVSRTTRALPSPRPGGSTATARTASSANRPVMRQRASQARHWMSLQTPAGPVTFSAW